VARSFAFVPRYRALAWAAVGVGGALTTASAIALAAMIPIASGVVGVALGAAYLMSPMWKLEVVIDDTGLEVRSPKASKFKVAWPDIVRVVASPKTHTCFVDGGAPERSFVVPGVGAPAPYDLADKHALYDAIVAHVDPAKVSTVETLEAARAGT
jgi:hypothetical protein